MVTALRSVIVMAALVVASVACQAAGTAAADLKLGDCMTFDSTIDANGDNAIQNTVVDCSVAHDAEVFLVIAVPGASDGGYPGDEAIGTLQQARCDAAFAGYVGKESGQSSYTIDYLRPDIDSWSHGDRTIDCLVEDASGGRLTGSAKGTKH